jgi:hypothetical protein
MTKAEALAKRDVMISEYKEKGDRNTEDWEAIVDFIIEHRLCGHSLPDTRSVLHVSGGD